MTPAPSAPTGKKILLIEKNDLNNRVMNRVLEQAGHQTIVTTNALDGLAAAQRDRPDLIILGTRFYPDDPTDEPWSTNGLCLLQKFHSLEAFRDIPIIIASADCMLGDIERAMTAGAAAHIALPIRPNDVLFAVRKVLGIPPASPDIPVPGSVTLPGTVSDANPPGELPIVDMKRLMDLTDGNTDSLRELIEIYFQQAPSQFAQMADAIRAGQPDVLRRAAHSCAGATAALGMNRLAPHLRALEKLAATGNLSDAESTLKLATTEFTHIRAFLQTLPELANLPSLWHSDSKSG